MSDYSNIPEEEMNYGSFSIEDITKTVAGANQTTPKKEEENEVETNEDVNVTQPSTLTSEDIQSVAEKNKTGEDIEPEGEPIVEDPIVEGYDANVYSAAIELAKENGLLNIPEDVGEITEEVWKDILAQNEYVREQRALNTIRSKAGDPKIVELLDYVMDGGTWYGYNEMQSTIQDEIDISTLDTKVEEDQRYLIEVFLSDGLDNNNPAHARRLQNIDNEVNNIFDRLEQDTLAEEAKQFLLDKTAQQKEYIKEQQKIHVQQQQAEEAAKQQARQQWNDQFKTTLETRPWSQTKKEEVISQFDIVQLTNGNEMELWQYKFDAIWRDPAATQVFMDFISDFDAQTLKFKRQGQPVNKQVTKAITGLINNKQTTSKNSRYTSNRRTSNTSLPSIDPFNS